MNKLIPIFIAALFFCIGPASAEHGGPADTVLQFFDASRNGDVAKMRELVSGSFYNRRKAVLENNDSYQDFLVEHFHGSTTNIVESTIDNNGQVAVVTATTHFKNESVNTSILVLKRDDTGTWKIVDE